MTDAPTGISSARIPGSVTFAGVGSLVLASLGVLGSAMGVLGVIVQRQSMETLRTMGSGDPEAARVTAPMIAMQERLLVPTLVGHTFAGLAAALLAAAGILVLLRHRLVPTVVPALLVGMALMAILDTGTSFWIQHATTEAMSSMFEGMVRESPGGPPRAMGEMESWFGMMGVVGYGCVGGWLLLKLTFVTWAALHLRSTAIAGLFGGPSILTGRGD